MYLVNNIYRFYIDSESFKRPCNHGRVTPWKFNKSELMKIWFIFYWRKLKNQLDWKNGRQSDIYHEENRRVI